MSQTIVLVTGPFGGSLRGSTRVRFTGVRPQTHLVMPQIQPWRVGTLIFTAGDARERDGSVAVGVTAVPPHS